MKGGVGVKELCIASVAGSDSLCLPVTNGLDSASVSNWAPLIFSAAVTCRDSQI